MFLCCVIPREHLAMMERMLGPVPAKLAAKSRTKHFTAAGRLRWDESSSHGRYVRRHCKPLAQYMDKLDPEADEDWLQMFDLIQKMLIYDTDLRINLTESLKHPFFSKLDTNPPTTIHDDGVFKTPAIPAPPKVPGEQIL